MGASQSKAEGALWPTSSYDRATEVESPDDESGLQVLPRNLHSTASQIELLARFQDIYNPCRRGSWRSLPTDLQDLQSWEWILSSLQHSQGEPLLSDVVLALVLGTVGRCDENTTYLQKGSGLHARAVKRLKQQLQSRQNRCSDETLAAVMVFGMYEVNGANSVYSR